MKQTALSFMRGGMLMAPLTILIVHAVGDIAEDGMGLVFGHFSSVHCFQPSPDIKGICLRKNLFVAALFS
jgi:hypothetical protein